MRFPTTLLRERRRSSRRKPAIALVVAAALVSGACSGPNALAQREPAPGAQFGGTLTVGVSAPGSVDPANAFEPSSVLITSVMCDTLLAEDPETGALRPAIAEGWLVTDNGRRFTIKLRKGVTFQDGSPVRALDVVYAFTRAASPEFAGRAADLLREIDGFAELRGAIETDEQLDRERLRGVKVVTDTSIEITLTAPNADFLAVLTHPVTAPVPQALAEADPDAFRSQPVCAGPYAIDGPWRPGDVEVAMSRYEGYYGGNTAFTNGGAGYVDHLVFRTVPEQTPPSSTPFPAATDAPTDVATDAPTGAATNIPIVAPPSLEGLDIARVPPFRWPEIEESPDQELVRAAGPGMDFIGIPFVSLSGGEDETTSREARQAEQFALRRALSLAIDRTAIADDIFDGARLPATSFMPPTLAGATPTPDVCVNTPDRADVAAARDALAAITIDPAARPLVLVFNDDLRNRDLVTAVAAQLEEALGITVRLDAVPFAEMLTRLGGDSTGIDLFRTSWSVPYPSPYAYLNALFHSSQFGEGNLSHFQDFRFDDLMDDEVRESAAIEDRGLLYAQAIDLLCEALPLIPIVVERVGYAFSQHVSSAGLRVGGHRAEPMLRELFIAS